jgi:Cytochrome c554 and c-prime
MSGYRLVLLGLAVAAALAIGAGLIRRQRFDTPDLPAASSPLLAHPAQARFPSTASCAGRSCHGHLTPASDADTVLLNEYTLWVTRDPHARAYQTLTTPQSAAMAHRLNLGKAHEAQRCLVCHTSPRAAETERTSGVGCEACHGNASHWLNAHTSIEWRNLDTKSKSAAGMVEVGDPEVLARQCVGCHVGAPPSDGVPSERDANHDLIAARHPRLAFEFSSFLANLPPHWKPRPRPETVWWAVGQTVAAEAALDLLRHRAARAQSPWPEFAEYDCFACHHELTASSKRSPQPSRRLGTMPWGTWYFAMPRALAADGLPELTALARLLEQPGAARTAIAQQSVAAATEMRSLAIDTRPRAEAPAFARNMMDRLLADRRLQDAASWESAEQTYLALQALNQVAKVPQCQAALDSLIDKRAFKPGWEGPASLPPGDFVAADFLDRLRERVQRRR